MRYFEGHATATTSPTLLSAQVLQADGSFRDPLDPTHKQTAKVGVDPTVVPGTGVEPLRISEDGRMAIENVNGTRQAKVFFADAGVVKASNQRLAKIGSEYLLQVSSAAALTVDDEKGKSHVLDAIEVVVNPNAGTKGEYKKIAPNLGGQQHGPETSVMATCNAVARAIMGHDDVPKKSRLEALKLFSKGDQFLWEVGLADAMVQGGQRKKEKTLDATSTAAIAKAYATMIQNQPVTAAKVAKKLGINTSAQPKVGQSFATNVIGLTLGKANQAGWNPLTDPGTSNPELKVNDATGTARSGMRRVAWGNHIGAVVASSKGNSVTFENYARDAEEGATVDSDVVGYFAMYGPVTKPTQTWHHVWTQGATPIPNGITAVV